ncbi:hypothetical protein ACHAWC_007983 [Mediolabrus comicus]
MTAVSVLLCFFFACTGHKSPPQRQPSSDVHLRHQLFQSTLSIVDSPQLDSDDCGNNEQKKIRFRSRVAYSGTPYSGFQLQPHRTTIQGEIEDALYRRYNRRIAVVGAGRTDAGVHARGQAIHFDLLQDEVPFSSTIIVHNATASERSSCDDFCNELQYSMNRMLPLEIRLFRLQLAPYEMSTKRIWHATQSSSSKWYSYRFTLGPTLLNPLERFVRTHIVHRPSFAPTSSCGQPYALTTDDITRLKSILEVYVGTHDFKAFGGQLEQNEKRSGKKMNTIRTIHTVELVKESFEFDSTGSSELNCFIGEEGNYRIDFLIEGALYKMVRNMVGTAIQVWLGNMQQTQLVELLQTDDSGDVEKSRKDNPCKPAPPEGLTLECVYYNDLF